MHNRRGCAALESLEARAMMSWTYFGPGSVPAQPELFDSAQNAVFADFDGDGVADRAASLLNTISFAKGHGDGTFDADRTTTVGAPVGRLTAGKFDGTGVASLIALGTRGGSVDYNRPNPGFRIRSIAFDVAAHADIGGTVAGAFRVMAELDVAEYNRHAPLPEAVAGDLQSGAREEFVINLGQGDDATNVVVFALKNRTTIERKGSVLVSALRADQVLVGDVDGSGKAQVVCTQVGATSDAIVRVFTANGGATWSAATVRTFPVRSMSIALGDMDGDGRMDIVALPIRSAEDGRLWTIRSRGLGAFDAPRALTRTFSSSEWAQQQYASPCLIGGIADLNGDGRNDVLLTFTDVHEYRLNDYTLRAVVATQSVGGRLDLVPVPIGLSGPTTIIGRTWGVRIGGAEVNGAPTLVVNRNTLLVAMAAQQPAQVLGGHAYVNGYVYGTSSVGLPATFTVKAWDADMIRGGSIARVEFVIDLNQNNRVDATDIVVGNVTTLDSTGAYTLIAPVDASWGAAPGVVHVLGRVFDDTGLVSDVWIFQMTV